MFNFKNEYKRMPGFLCPVFLFCILFSLPTHSIAGNNTVSSAVVKIYTVKNQYNYHEPWQKIGLRQYQGSGSIISGNRILTNAHVISDKTFVQVRRAGEAKKYTASVVAVQPSSDLAILSVDDLEFFRSATPLEIGDLPFVRDKVSVYGYPDGGDTLSITEGVVSRIEHQEYFHSNVNMLACQIDAPINSGNSGGPVVVNNKLVGVAFQGLYGPTTENIGYMVPAPVIKHFLRDIEDSHFGGIPELGLSMQKMENLDLRKKYQLDENETGILVNKIYPDSPAEGIIFPDDVILAIDDNTVENDGTILFRDGERTLLAYHWQQKQLKDTIKLTLKRSGVKRDVRVTLNRTIGYERLVPHKQFDKAPTFYIAGGLVFSPLTRNYLEEYGTEQNWGIQAPKDLMTYYIDGEPTKERREVILLINVLADEINVGYHAFTNGIITKVNGKNISTMKDLVQAFESNRETFHTIEDIHGYKIVLNRQKSKDSAESIFRRYLVPADRSADLQGLKITNQEK